jgi:hypothetical protein
MSVTSIQIVDRERYLNQIDKLVHSHTFRKAESLCKLLRYLAEHELSQPGTSPKEYQIATEVFGRPQDFDPQADSAVRVQAGRLRLKLLDYYSHEGAADSIVVEVPNGSYALSFHDREPSTLTAIAPQPAAVIAPVHPEFSAPVYGPATRKIPRRWIITVAALSLVLAIAVTAIVVLLIALKSAQADRPGEVTASPAVRAFWSPFASSPYAPWVIFSNAAFVGRPETGMRYLDPARDSRPLILDHYTGVGEVLAVHELDQVFNRLNHRIRVKRGSLFSLDDANENDLIFVGSPAENLTLLDLPGSREFVFTRGNSGPHKGELAIRNVHPDPGQPALFYPTESSQPLEEDYAIVALVHGLNPSRHVMILAGTTTIGTQAAVGYVCEQDSVEELMRNLAPHGGEIKPFEALLRVKVTRGVPVGIQLVAVRHLE